MKIKTLLLFLALQVLAIVVAGASFSVVESRFTAGMIAGTYFIVSGLYMVGRTYTYRGKWALALWYPLLVHVFVISIPMVLTRIVYASSEFGEVRILGLEGPTFHRLSTTVFSILIVGTLIDIARVWWAKKPTTV